MEHRAAYNRPNGASCCPAALPSGPAQRPCPAAPATGPPNGTSGRSRTRPARRATVSAAGLPSGSRLRSRGSGGARVWFRRARVRFPDWRGSARSAQRINGVSRLLPYSDLLALTSSSRRGEDVSDRGSWKRLRILLTGHVDAHAEPDIETGAVPIGPVWWLDRRSRTDLPSTTVRKIAHNIGRIRDAVGYSKMNRRNRQPNKRIFALSLSRRSRRDSPRDCGLGPGRVSRPGKFHGGP